MCDWINGVLYVEYVVPSNTNPYQPGIDRPEIRRFEKVEVSKLDLQNIVLKCNVEANLAHRCVAQWVSPLPYAP